jgi:hypothetical protein
VNVADRQTPPIARYGQITGNLDGVDGTWFVELSDSGCPHLPLTLIPVDAMLDVVPVWSIELPIRAADGVSFTDEEQVELGMRLMRRRMAELKGEDAGS